MADRMDRLTDRVQVVEGKVDHLTERVDVVEVKLDQLTERVQVLDVKVDEGFRATDARFGSLDAAFIEQREYTEFSHARLEAKMDAGFSRVDAGFTRLERKMDQLIDRRPRRRRS